MSMPWTITEDAVTELHGFDVAWLPREAYRFLAPRLNLARGAVEIAADDHVGTIPLLNGDSLQIVPKVGIKAFGRMVLVAEGLEGAVSDEFDQLVALAFDEDVNESWVPLLARSFVRLLQTIEKKSLRAGRARTEARLWYVRGRVEALSTTLSLARHERTPVHCCYKERTTDTAENRVLAAAAAKILQVRGLDQEARETAVRWAGRIRMAELADDLETVVGHLRTGRYMGSRPYYIPALLTAHLILAGAGLGFDSERLVEGEAFLLNSSTLFERYVRAIVSRVLAPEGFVVEKGSVPPSALFTDGTCELVPDVMVSDESGFRLLLDAKYKRVPAVPAGDYYQVVAYLTVYELSVGVIVLPMDNPGAASVSRKFTADGKVVLEVRVPLNDWRATEAFVGEILWEVLR